MKSHSILPMIKANGYGHGDSWVVRALKTSKNLYGFGVITLDEAIKIRNEVPQYRGPILVFSGHMPWTRNDGQCMEKFGLTPIISSLSDWKDFKNQNWQKRLDFQLKFNTGMNRLGIPTELTNEIIHDLNKTKSYIRLRGVLSHLACSEKPTKKISKLQLRKFTDIRTQFDQHFSHLDYHFANSGAIWNHNQWRLKTLTNVVRPGLSLYGIPPWPNAEQRGLKPVLTLLAKILQVRELRRGEYVGYGGTFRAQKQSRVAVIGAGYADGIPRTLSNRGHVMISNKKRPLVGVISMDSLTVLCSRNEKEGNWVELLGPRINPWIQAQAASTIPYELFTSLSGRVERIYE